ncbi:MAG TPA: class I SAM-dependent methyltransferase [Solirubrobacteraceae bacterium]|nr:class I SAM-dependent methyltransferase [Solirubrobacteraceae bacterium]
MTKETVTLRPVPFVWETLKRLTPQGGTVVDVGCGPSLYRSAVSGRYIGVDITDAPYRDGVPRDVDVVAPADAMPLADETVDLIFTLSAFYQMGDSRKVLAEFRRVLRPGGRLLIVDYNRRTRRRLAPKENLAYPAWSQWRLVREVRGASFHQVHLLTATEHETRGFERLRRLVLEELRGQWAIVTGVR